MHQKTTKLGKKLTHEFSVSIKKIKQEGNMKTAKTFCTGIQKRLLYDH